MNEINKIELIGSHVHPGLEQIEYDGWLLNLSGQEASRRANSVLPLETGIISLEQKISECQKIYAEHKLPCIFKLSDGSPEGLDELLNKKGFVHNADTKLMYVAADDIELNQKLESIVEDEDIGVILTSKPDQEWFDSYFVFEERTEPLRMEIETKQFALLDDNRDLNSMYCRIQKTGKDVAVASVTIEDGKLFLLNVVVAKEFRGKGYGKILVKNVLEAGISIGAEKLYLQVSSDNEKAIKLYESFGFKLLYNYWYMVK